MPQQRAALLTGRRRRRVAAIALNATHTPPHGCATRAHAETHELIQKRCEPMASPKDKNEEEILERIAALYGQLDDIRDQRREVHTVGTEDGPRVVLVTRRLPRDRRRGQRVPDTMDQALSNFRQVTAWQDVYWVGSP